MSVSAPAAASRAQSPWAQLRAALPALAIGLVAIGLLFWREITVAVEVWDASTAYNHCFLVLPIAAWLAWERRNTLAYVPVQAEMRAVLLSLPLLAAWFVADRIGVMEGRQLAVIGLVEVLFLGVLGWRLFHLLLAPLLYLIFLVPFGAFLTPWLQDVTLWFTLKGLDLMGILYYSDGLVIEIQAGTFVIAEACAGLRFLIASIAFGTLYACTIYRSTTRRVIFIILSIIVPIIANGFRAFGIVLAGYLLGSAEAAAADHVIYGWVFFSFVTLLLIAIGLPFREDRGPPAAIPPMPADLPAPERQGALRVAVVASLLAAIGPATTMALDHAGPARPAPQIALGGDCQPAPPVVRRRPMAASVQELQCNAGRLQITVAVFPPNANPSHIVSAQRLLSGEDGASESEANILAIDGPDGPRWRVVEAHTPQSVSATALWLDGKPGMFGLRARIIQARASLLGGQHAPVLVAVRPTADTSTLPAGEMKRLRLVLSEYLRQRRDWPGRFAELSAATAR